MEARRISLNQACLHAALTSPDITSNGVAVTMGVELNDVLNVAVYMPVPSLLARLV